MRKDAVATKKRIKQAVCRWCYQKMPIDDLCAAAAQMGLFGIDLLNPDEYEVPRRHGLICTMGYADAGTIPEAMNRTEHHAAIEAALQDEYSSCSKSGCAECHYLLGKSQRHG